MKRPNLLFIYDHPHPEWWMDGLSSALTLLEKDFNVQRLNLSDDNNVVVPDFILGWGAFGSSVDKWLQERKGKKGLCIAGNAVSPYNEDSYDVLFYETDWYKPTIKHHKNIVKAFGVNTDIFNKIDITTPIIWDYIGVGAFASWKRWELMKKKKGRKLVVGEYQQDNEQESLSIVRDLVKNGTMVSPAVNPFDLSMYYRWSRKLYMPSDINGGGERAILEARSCGLEVEIEGDNPKLQELVLVDPIPTEKDYYKSLKKGIMSVL